MTQKSVKQAEVGSRSRKLLTFYSSPAHLFFNPRITYLSVNVINFTLLHSDYITSLEVKRLRLKMNTLRLLSCSLCSIRTGLLSSQECRSVWMRREVRRDFDLFYSGLTERKCTWLPLSASKVVTSL